MRSKRRRLIPSLTRFQCSCGNIHRESFGTSELDFDALPECVLRTLQSQAAFSSSDEDRDATEECFPICVDTHVHLNEVLLELSIREQVPSLDKSWKDMTEPERQAWTILGWDKATWTSSSPLDWDSLDFVDGSKVWKNCTTKHGTVYFWNVKTGETVWEIPEDQKDFPSGQDQSTNWMPRQEIGNAGRGPDEKMNEYPMASMSSKGDLESEKLKDQKGLASEQASHKKEKSRQEAQEMEINQLVHENDSSADGLQGLHIANSSRHVNDIESAGNDTQSIIRQKSSSKDGEDECDNDAWSKEYQDLKPEEQHAAIALGYNSKTWPGNWNLAPLVIPSVEKLRSIFPPCGCICTACDPDALGQLLKLHSAFPMPPERSAYATDRPDAIPIFMWASLGCHPKAAGSFVVTSNDPLEDYGDFERDLKKAASELGSRLVAWGEIGLDYSHVIFGRNPIHQNFQKQAFQRQLAIGLELGLPLCIHSRDAWEDTLRILCQMVPSEHPIHVHCFLYGKEELNQLLSSFPKAVIGVTNYVFIEGSEARALCPQIPLENLVLETDGPYMPRNGQSISSPKDIPQIGKEVAELKGLPLKMFMEAVRNNVLRTYKI